MFEETTQTLTSLRQQLSERVSPRQAIPGTMVAWRTPAGHEYGVVVGRDGDDLLVGVAYDKALKNDRRVKMYRDEALSAKVSGVGGRGVVMDIHRIPAKKAYVQGRMRGQAIRPYVKLGMALESREGADMFEAANDKMIAIRHSLMEGKDKVCPDCGAKMEGDMCEECGEKHEAGKKKRKRKHAGHAYARRTPNLPQDMQVYKGESETVFTDAEREVLEGLRLMPGVVKLKSGDLKRLADDARSMGQTAKELGMALDMAAKNGLDGETHMTVLRRMETLMKPLGRIKKGLKVR